MKRSGWFWPALLIALALALGVAVTMGLGGPEERALMRDFAFREGRTPAATIAATQWITWAGDAAQRWILIVVLALWLWLLRKRPRAALLLLVTVALAGVASDTLKFLFDRARPDVVPPLDLVKSESYPSGHALNAMVVLLLGALLLARRGWGLWIALAVVGALIVGVSRTLLGVHYPTDLIGGWLLGIAFALIGWRVAQRLEPISVPVPDAPPAIFPAQSPEPLARSDGLHPSGTATADHTPHA